MRQLCTTLFWAVLVCLPGTIHATHIVGGEITYRCLGGQTYQVQLTVYRDCYNGRPPFDDPAIVGVYENDTDFLFRKLELAYDALLQKPADSQYSGATEYGNQFHRQYLR
ncbi:MAG: hypothetical protein LW693_14975 [Saprospiraceae bacterium]|nr:hypothetical protein [Saprospiraceae bacterium]